MDYSRHIIKYIENEIDVLKKIDINSISKTLNVLVNALNEERNIYIFGNGGSAATASHFQNDFNKGVSEYTEKKFRFICLNDNIATIMAIANDIGYEEIFRFQLRGRIKEKDIVIAISGSGNSKNVINAVGYAKSQGAIIIGLTGYNGGILKGLSDICLHVEIDNMQITEDIHMMFDHMMMSVLCEVLQDRQIE